MSNQTMKTTPHERATELKELIDKYENLISKLRTAERLNDMLLKTTKRM